MATTSTIPTVKAQLVTQIATALATAGAGSTQIPTTYAWAGPQTASEAVFLGPHPETADIRLDASHEVPTIKAGRKARQEDYTVRVTVWVFRPDLTPADAATCEARAFTIAALIESVVADDPRIGLAVSVVQQITAADIASTLFPFKSGWVCELSIDFRVQARLS